MSKKIPIKPNKELLGRIGAAAAGATSEEEIVQSGLDYSMQRSGSSILELQNSNYEKNFHMNSSTFSIFSNHNL